VVAADAGVALDPLARLRPARATIDLGRLAANYRAVTAAVPVPIMPVVKADAYGHGAVPVARRLAALGAPLLAVAYVEEAVELREGGITIPIVVMAGFTAGQLPDIERHALVPVVGSASTLRAMLGRPAGSPRITVHLKVDTGMNRLGLSVEEALAAVAPLLGSGTADLGGILTHLASADEDEGATRRQLDLFDDVLARLAARGVRAPFVHAANSAGLAFHRPTHTLARPGLLLYGARPRPLSPDVAVRPVMSLTTEISAVRDVAPGAAVSYGGRWTAARPSRIATLPIGYADGIARTQAMRERGFVIVHGQRCPVAGTICMDLMMADVTDVPGAADGDAALLMGDSPTAWDVADWAGTNAWEAMTRLGSRVPRVYVEDGRVVDIQSRYNP
jgi:alanine racemase